MTNSKDEFVVLSVYEVHMASAAIMVDGNVVAAAHEERFVRKKNHEGFPLEAISFCFKAANILPEQVDVVAISNSTMSKAAVAGILFRRMSQFSIDQWVDENNRYWGPKMMGGESDLSYFRAMGGWDAVYDNHHYDLSQVNFDAEGEEFELRFNEVRRETVSRLIGIPKEKVRFLPHYLLHHYHAYYSSPRRGMDMAIVHSEGSGGDFNQAVSIPTARGLQLINGSAECDIGRLYQWITLLLGMKPYSHEYKLMGLAPHANDFEIDRSYKVLKDIFLVNTKKMIVEYSRRPKDLYFSFREKLEGHRFDGIAGAVQKITEQLMSRLVDSVIKGTGRRRIALGGGVAMNVKANLVIAQLPELEELVVPLAPSDEGNVFGAGYLVTEEHFLKIGKSPELIPPLASPYLGSCPSKSAIKGVASEAARAGYIVQTDNTLEVAMRLLESGGVIGYCQGRSEFGQRALGGRSIIADPSNPAIPDKINQQIKYRDFWMPFAPSILEEDFDEYLLNPKKLDASYMTVAFNSSDEGRRSIPAGLHAADATARPHCVTADIASEYYKLIKGFKNLTGIGALLNTSFNLHGEPIVDTPEDALDVFDRSELSALMLDEVLIQRHDPD